MQNTHAEVRLEPGYLRDLYRREANELIRFDKGTVSEMTDEIFAELMPPKVQEAVLEMFEKIRRTAEVNNEDFARAVAREAMGNPFVQEVETEVVRIRTAPGFNREFYSQRLGNFNKWPRETKFFAILRVLRNAPGGGDGP